MPIDWFTIVAQAINFLILVWLLKRFLYKPILNAIDERERGIRTQLAKAEEKKAAAQKERDDLQRKNDVFDQERAALLKNATDEAEAQRQRLLDEARKDADSLRAKRQEQLGSEQRNLSQEITRWTQKQVFAITRKTLEDLAAASLEERMGDVFVDRLRALTGSAKEQLAAALKSSKQPARVRSAFNLPAAKRSEIESAIKETLGAETQVQFETAPDVVSGIELSSNGQKVAWSIADYLATLEKSASELLRVDAKPKSNTGANSMPEAQVTAKSIPKVVAKPEPKSEPKGGPEPVALPPKVHH
jgi:F-type H+-transporting ATPase subunit b